MAVTADMEHLRNREGQHRNMTTPIAHCVRCQRPAPAEDDPDFLHWEVLDDVDMVCPECETPQEKQAIDEEDMRLADEVDDSPHNPRSNKRPAATSPVKMASSREVRPVTPEYEPPACLDAAPVESRS